MKNNFFKISTLVCLMISSVAHARDHGENMIINEDNNNNVVIIQGSNINYSSGSNLTKASYNFVREDRKVDSFNEITIKCPAIIKYKKGSQGEVKIKAPDNVMKSITTTVSNNKLVIELSENFSFNGPIEFEITGDDLNNIVVEGKANIVIDDLNTKNLNISVSGSSDLHIKGKVNNLSVSVSGLGNIHADKLKAENVLVAISGSGTVEAYASNSSELNVSGLGNVNIFGKPKNRKENVTGVGHIKYY